LLLSNVRNEQLSDRSAAGRLSLRLLPASPDRARDRGPIMGKKKKHGKKNHAGIDAAGEIRADVEEIEAIESMRSDLDQKSDKKKRKKNYLHELAKMEVELVKLQEWIKNQGLRVVVIFEGRDAAGKGGVIKRITQSLNPRVCRVVAL